MTTFRKEKNMTFWPHPRGWWCVLWQHICFHGALCSIPFNFYMQNDYFQTKMWFDLLTHSLCWECVCGKTICYYVAARVVSFNLICNMTILWKSSVLASAPPPKSTPGALTQAFKLISCLLCFISIATLPACKKFRKKYWQFFCLFVWFDSLRPINNLSVI